MKTTNTRQLLKKTFALGIACLILFTPSVSQGWGAGGHMMVAHIAFQRLNPNARARAQELLAIEIEPADVSAQSKDFVSASHWADDLRPFASFDSFKPLHFIDKPFSTDGTALPSDLPEPDNIVKALQDNVNILRTSTDKNQQAQALRFIIHFVGDIHQPLHSAARVDVTNPTGDQGGNLFKIRIRDQKGNIKDTNLHSYWDGGIGTFPPTGPNFKPPPLRLIPAAAAKARAGNPRSDPKLKLDEPFNFDLWADESFAIAQDVTYNGIRKGSIPTNAYRNRAIRVVRKRVAWGGYRLAALLNAIWP